MYSSIYCKYFELIIFAFFMTDLYPGELIYHFADVFSAC